MGIYSLFAGILDYPMHRIDGVLTEASRTLAAGCPDACAVLEEFRSAIEPMSLTRLQETYTDTFDMRPEGTTNLSYHMFGEDQRRGVFMAEIKGKMEALGLPLGVELPDHISLILRYMDRASDEERAILTEDCFLPSLKKMHEVIASCGSPYIYALEALEKFLKLRKPMAAAEMVSARETRVP